MSRRIAALVIGAIFLAAAGRAMAQETRAEVIRQEQADKVVLTVATGAYIRAEIFANGGPDSWAEPAHVYFQRDAAGWTLVGFERVPGGNAPGVKGAKRGTN